MPSSAPGASPSSRFDAQAASFDARAGLPQPAAARIAGELRALAASVEGAAEPGLLLEIGAGTGLLALADAGPDERHAYVGLDLSLPMLAVFHRRLDQREPGRANGRRLLVRADADRPWPLADGTVSLVASSRAAHLLEPSAVVREACRVGRRDGFAVVLGSVRRPDDSVRTCLRAWLHELLRDDGVTPRDGGRALDHLAERFTAAGAHLEERDAASWPRFETPRRALDAWRSKDGLAGRRLAPLQQRRILDQLERRARERFGDLDARHQSTDTYRLTIARFGAAPETR